MRHLVAIACVIGLCAGCGRRTTSSTTMTTTVTSTVGDPSEELPKEPEGVDPLISKTTEANGEKTPPPDPEILGRPFSSWAERAVGPSTPEERVETIEALVLALDCGVPAAVVEAADLLAVLKPETIRASAALVGKLGDARPWIRVSAMEALQKIGTPAVPALAEAVETSDDRAVRRRSALVLKSIGPDAAHAIPLFEAALDDESSAVHDLAAGVLAALRGEESPADIENSTVPADEIPRGDATDVLLAGGDWPQFHGPARDSICRQKGLLSEWPAEGPDLLWKLEGLGVGYSGISIADGRIFTMGDRTGPDAEPSQFIVAYDLPTRSELWATSVSPPHDDGPRSTPTVDGELLYAIGTEGDLLCVEAATGVVRWQKSLPDDFGGRMMSKWKYSESPLVDGDRLLCTPGGPQSAIVALDKRNGELLWQCELPGVGPEGNDGAGYASMTVAEIRGVRQVVQVMGRGVVGVEAETGRLLWSYNEIANTIANICSPAVWGDYVFATTGYGTGSVLLRISRDGESFAAEPVYRLGAREFENHHGGVVLLGGHLYGGHGTNKGAPVCLDLATGQIAWKAQAPERGSAAVLYADGHLIFRYDRGLVALVEATPEEFRLKGSFRPIAGEGPGWPHPVIHDGKLYLRHNDLLSCYDLSVKE